MIKDTKVPPHRVLNPLDCVSPADPLQHRRLGKIMTCSQHTASGHKVKWTALVDEFIEWTEGDEDAEHFYFPSRLITFHEDYCLKCEVLAIGNERGV
jgi:hypothetical protein